MIACSTRANIYTKIVYLCPSTPKGSCQWEGDASHILEHFQQSHKDLLMDSNTIKADVTQDSEENRLIASEKGLFLVQTKVSVEKAKLWIRLRFLSSEELTSKIRYSIEVSIGKFGFTNENSLGDYNPVYNVENGVEVDIQAIKLIGNVRTIRDIALKININEDISEHKETVGESECESYTISEINENKRDAEENKSNDNHVSEIDSCDCLEEKSELKNINESCEEYESFSETMINCTNCHYNMIPPIFMCPDGHSVCYSCRNHICSICGQKITELRNIDLEEHSKTLEYPCRYETQGCMEKHKFNEIRKHEIHCDYCTYKCQLCPSEGRLFDIKSHFRIAHPSAKIHETMCRIHFPRGSNFVIMNTNGVFYCTSYATEMYIEWKVVYCGPKERYFSCEVQIAGKKQTQPVKHYFLKRNENTFKLTVSFEELKSANVKEKNSYLYISCY